VLFIAGQTVTHTLEAESLCTMKFRIRIIFGICSYAASLVLLFFPFFSGSEVVAAAQIIPFVCGALLLAGASLTNYELGLARLIRFRDTAILTIGGCALILLSPVFVSYGHQLCLISVLAATHGVVSLLAYRTHGFARQHAA
jgi:hypothetical protein